MNLIKIPKLFLLPFVITLFTACSNQNVEPPQAPAVKVEPVVEKKEPVVVRIDPVILKNDTRQELLKFVKTLMNDFAKNDLNLINTKYINPKFGFYNLYKLNGENSFSHQNKIFNFNDDDMDEIWTVIRLLTDDIKNFVLIEQDVKFDCSPINDEYYGWNGSGLYLSKKTNTYLSDMMKDANFKEINKYSQKDIETAEFIEKNGYKVVLTPELVFYLNKIGKKWYITLFDRITTDCSTPKITKQ